MSALSPTLPEAGARASRVELILRQIEQLPTLPAVAARLLQVATSHASTAREVAAVIETDPALTARVLALVRSAAVTARDVTTVERAVVILGFEAVRAAVLSLQVYDTFKKAEPDVETPFNRIEFWKHSLAVACAARLIAGRMRLKQEGEAFVCGLLHDMGKLALDACLPKSYARVVRQVMATRQCLCDVERELIGVDHTTAGRRLATRWRLPRAIVDCVWLHHQPPESLPDSLESPQLVRIVHLADSLVRQQRIGFSGYTHLDSPAPCARLLGLVEEDLDELLETLPLEIEKNCRLIGIDQLNGARLYARALADSNAELGRVNAELAETNRKLRIRSRCFEGLARFTGALSLDCCLADVCLAAARCMREILEIPAAAGFYYEPDSDSYHLGMCGANGDRVATFVNNGTSAASARGVTARSACIAGLVGPVPPMAAPVIAQCESELGAGALRMLSISHAGLVVGGVIFCADDEPQRGELSSAELEALSVAFGLAAASAADRTRSDRLSEEMALATRQLHQSQDALLRSRAVLSIGEMAAGAAHELNNPLAVISGRAQMLAGSLADADQQRAARIIHEQASRASDLVTELIQFAKPEPASPREIRLTAWLHELRERWLAQSSLGSGQFTVTLSDPELCVYADPRQLERIMDALLANTVEATDPNSARVKVNSTSLSSDETVIVTVEDNGVGMSPEVVQHATDPFFSHRKAGRGRGMGLSHAVRLAAHNGGRLWLESTPGRGTTVFLELPGRVQGAK